MEAASRIRLCSLCQQCYGSGMRDHVAASDILRSRRMLLDRSSDARVRDGLELFLDDMTRQSTDLKHQQLLSVCAFCVQFLPPMYQEDKLVDDLRHQLLSAGTVHNHQTTLTRRKTSNLVIQHQIPRSGIKSSLPVPQPAHPQTYRLLTDEITRVLHLDASAVHSSLGAQSNLMSGDTINDLRQKEKLQSASFLAARRASRDARLTSAQQNSHIRPDGQSLSSDINYSRTEKRNLVRAIANPTTGASSIYTGVLIHPPSRPKAPGDLSKGATRAKVIVVKHGRHFKTELRFPLLPK